jgi:hypothetical protein
MPVFRRARKYPELRFPQFGSRVGHERTRCALAAFDLTPFPTGSILGLSTSGKVLRRAELPAFGDCVAGVSALSTLLLIRAHPSPTSS